MKKAITRRRTISRREPVIALKSFRHLGRNYEEGMLIDRRKVRMKHTKLNRFINSGICILAKNLDKHKLEGYGYVYNNALRYRLKSIKDKPGVKSGLKPEEKLVDKELPW